jgi:hypothetical protein
MIVRPRPPTLSRPLKGGGDASPNTPSSLEEGWGGGSL